MINPDFRSFAEFTRRAQDSKVGPSAQEQAKVLLDSGSLTREEFDEIARRVQRDSVSLSDEVQTGELESPESQASPLLQALTPDPAETTSDVSVSSATVDCSSEQDSRATAESSEGFESLAKATEEGVIDPFQEGASAASLSGNGEVPESFLSKAGVESPGDSGDKTASSLTVDLSDPSAARGQVDHEILRQGQASDRSHATEEQAAGVTSRLHGDLASHQAEQSSLDHLSTSQSTEVEQGQARIDDLEADLEERGQAIDGFQEAGNARAAQVGQMRSHLDADTKALEDAVGEENQAIKAELNAEISVSKARRKAVLAAGPDLPTKAQGAPADKSQAPAADAQRLRVSQRAQAQEIQGGQITLQAEQRTDQAGRQKDAAQARLDRNRARVATAQQGLNQFSSTLDGGLKGRQATEDQVARNHKTLQASSDGLRHLGARRQDVASVIEQNQADLQKTTRIGEVAHDNAQAADGNVQRLKDLLPQMTPGRGEDRELGRSPNPDHQAHSPRDLESAGQGATSRASDSPTQTSRHGDKLTIELATSKSIASEVSAEANAGGSRARGYVGEGGGQDGASIASAEARGSAAGRSPEAKENRKVSVDVTGSAGSTPAPTPIRPVVAPGGSSRVAGPDPAQG